jgi:hypothetical protein
MLSCPLYNLCLGSVKIQYTYCLIAISVTSPAGSANCAPLVTFFFKKAISHRLRARRLSRRIIPARHKRDSRTWRHIVPITSQLLIPTSTCFNTSFETRQDHAEQVVADKVPQAVVLEDAGDQGDVVGAVDRGIGCAAGVCGERAGGGGAA